MPTPAERQALLFLAGVIVLGAGVRVVRAARSGETDAGTRAALARQLAAVDSARSSEGESKPRRASSARGKPKRSTTRPGAQRDSAHTAYTGLPPTLGLGKSGSGSSGAPIDLDVANAAEIETLPRIGPALAQRIVEDREQHGPFGSLEGFDRVRGVGPSLVALLRERVTFSGTARPSNAVVDNRLRSAPPRSKSSRRERRP